MVELTPLLLSLFIATVRVEAMLRESSGQVYRLPVYPLKPINMTVDCFDVSTDHSENEFPVNVVRFLQHYTHEEENYSVHASVNFMNHFAQSQSAAFTRAVAYGRLYQLCSQYLYWLDNIYTLTQSVLFQVSSKSYYFDSNAYDKIFLKGSFITIYYNSNTSETDLEGMTSFLEMFPGILYISLKNDSVPSFDQDNMQALQSEKIANILSLFVDTEEISDQTLSVEEFTVNLQTLLLELEHIFMDNQDIAYPVYPPYTMVRDWQDGFGEFSVKSTAEYEHLYIPNFTICGVETTWKLPKLLETVLKRAFETFASVTNNFSSFVKYEIAGRFDSLKSAERCSEVSCWRRETWTLMALPAPYIDNVVFESCFTVYFVADTFTPNVRIGVPSWIDEYLHTTSNETTSNSDVYKGVYTLRNLHKVFERTLNFITYLHNLKEYMKDILGDRSVQPTTKIPKESFHRDFMEMGYYILQRNAMRFPNEIINQLTIDLLKSYVDVVNPLITDDPVTSQDQGTIGLDSICHNLLMEMDSIMKEFSEEFGNVVGISEVSTIECPMFLKVYEHVKEISESLESYDGLFNAEKWVIESNDVWNICATWSRRRPLEVEEDVESALDKYSEELNDAALSISSAAAANIYSVLKYKSGSYSHCTGSICDVIVFNTLTVTMGQPCISPSFVGFKKDPVFFDYVPKSLLQLLSPLTYEETFSFFGTTWADPLETLRERQLKLLKVNVHQIIFSQLGQCSMWLSIMMSKSGGTSDNYRSTQHLDIAETYFQRLHEFRERFSYIGYQGLVLLEQSQVAETDLSFDNFLLKVGTHLFQDSFSVEKTAVESLDDSEGLENRNGLNMSEIFSDTGETVEIRDETIVGSLVKNVSTSVAELLEGRSAYKLTKNIFDFQDIIDNGIFIISVCPRNVSNLGGKQIDLLDAIDGHLHYFSEALLGLIVELYGDKVMEGFTIPRSEDNDNGNENNHQRDVTESGEENDEEHNGDQTESTPQEDVKDQYRAFYVPSPNQVFVQHGEAKEFQLEINALRRGFENVKKEDITITIKDLRSFRNETTVTMTVVEVTSSSIIFGVFIDASAEWSFAVTINDQPILNGLSEDTLEISMRIEHKAPVCHIHRFADSGNSIIFEFDIPVRIKQETESDCGDIFEDVSKLGKGAKCDMKTPKVLVVTIGKGKNLIVPGDILGLKSNIVSPARQMFYQPLSTKGFSIDSPHNPQQVSFTIDGPKRINRCGLYQLRAEQIAGHGGRPVNYRWQPYQLDEGGVIQDLELFNIQNELNEGRGTAVLPIDASGLTSGERYAYSLEITNFLGQVHTEYHVLAVLNNVSPVVQIKPVNIIPSRVKASSRIKLETVVTYSFGEDCQSNENIATYEWSDSNGLIPKDLRNDRILVLPGNTLPVGETIQLTVTVASIAASGSFTIVTPVKVSESITLTTIATPLVAEIGGASKLKLGPEETIELDGSGSRDPDDGDSATLNYEWDCVQITNKESCRNSLGNRVNTPKLSLQTSRFEAGRYTISLTVSEGSRRSTTSVTVTITDTSVPIVKLKTRSKMMRFRDNENIYVQAHIVSTTSVSVTWRESNDRMDSQLWEKAVLKEVRDEAEYRTHIKILADQTRPGAEYTIEVMATDQNGNEGMAALDISIYQTISQCEVDATPYSEMQEMTLTASGCVTDPESEPLTYQPFFALPLEDGYKTIILDGSKGESSQTVIATPIDYNNDNILVGFKVCDASLTCIDALATTLYQPTTALSEDEQDKFIAEKVDKELDKGNVAKAFSNAINIVNMQKKSLTTGTRRKRGNIVDEYIFLYTDDLDSVLLVVDQLDLTKDNAVKKRFEELGKTQAKVLSKVEPVDSDEGAVILDLSSQMVQSTFNEGDIDTILNAAERIFKKAEEDGFRHKSETIERALTTLDNSAKNIKETSSKEKRNVQKRKINDLRKAAMTQAAHGLNIGDHVTFNISGSPMSVVCFLPEENEPADIEIPVKLHPGRSLSERFMYDWCTASDEACSGVKLLMIPAEDLDEEKEKCSGLTDITLLDPVTDIEQEAKDLADPIEIEMIMTNTFEDQICVCKYWNEETAQLESEGVTSEITIDGNLVCRSNHLTTFVGEVIIESDSNNGPSATHGYPKSPSNSPLGVILGIVFGVLLVTLGVILVGTVMFKLMKKKKVSPDGE